MAASITNADRERREMPHAARGADDVRTYQFFGAMMSA